MREGVEAAIDHPQDIAQVLLPLFAPGQIGEISGDARMFRRTIILVEGYARDCETAGLRHVVPL